jgi:hypothetical protein
MRVFFDWPGRSEGKKANPETVHAFCNVNEAALGVLRAELPRVIGWVEFRPESQAGAASPQGLSYRITDRGRSAAARDEAPEDRTPVMVRLGSADLATLDDLITAGIVNSRAEGLRWALSHIREHPGLHPAPEELSSVGVGKLSRAVQRCRRSGPMFQACRRTARCCARGPCSWSSRAGKWPP